MDSTFNILDVIPHDQPMSLLDNILEHNEAGLTAGVTITNQSLFAEDQGVPSWVGVEYMGQAIAAYAGVCARKQNQPVKIGFLVSVRRYEPGCAFFPIFSHLEIHAEPITDSDTGLQVFNCRIKGTNIDIRANLNVFMPDDLEAFLEGEK